MSPLVCCLNTGGKSPPFDWAYTANELSSLLADGLKSRKVTKILSWQNSEKIFYLYIEKLDHDQCAKRPYPFFKKFHFGFSLQEGNMKVNIWG